MVWPKQVPRGALPRFQFKNHHRAPRLTFTHIDAWRRLVRAEPSPNEVRLMMQLDQLYHRVLDGTEVIESEVTETPQQMSAEAIKSVMRAMAKDGKKKAAPLRGLQHLTPAKKEELPP